MFDTIAARYDLANDVLSLGLHRLWKRRLVKLAQIVPGAALLDVCCGTGDVTILAAMRGAEAVGVDLSPAMLELARARAQRFAPRLRMGPPRFVEADATALPFSNNSFQAVTCAYGLRNVPDRCAALTEMRRVLVPGGRLAILDFGKPTFAPVRALYYWWLAYVVPRLGGILTGQRSAYEYILSSLLAFPDQTQLAAELQSAGFDHVRVTNLCFGTMWIVSAIKPPGYATRSLHFDSVHDPTRIELDCARAVAQPQKCKCCGA